MRSLDFYYNVIKLKGGDLGDAKTAATRETDDDPIASVVRRSAGPGRQIGQDACKLPSAQKARWVKVPRCDKRHSFLRLKWESWAVTMSTEGWPEGKENHGPKSG
jgi:hypothetical protein